MSESASKKITPGQLVLITGSAKGRSPNIGKVATAEFIINTGSSFKGLWFSDSAMGCWLITGENLQAMVGKRPVPNMGFSVHQECHLMPINPEADPLETTQTTELEKVQ